jgi:hypothetical protein
MRWKLVRRGLSISAPRVIVRSALPWPLRWLALALVLCLCAALALWAFERGRDLAGLDPAGRADVGPLRAELAALRIERNQAQGLADAAESLLKAERTTQERLAAQVRQLETENLDLKNDLGFFERLLPADGREGLVVRGLQAEVVGTGQLRLQLLVMQQGRPAGDFRGRYDVTLRGEVDGHGWSLTPPGGGRVLQFRQYQRVDGLLEFPVAARVQGVQVRVVDAQGAVRATQEIRL